MTDANNSVPPPAVDQAIVSDLVEITIKTIDSKNFQFQVENDIQIKAFKERIAEQVGIEAQHQRMIFCGRVLADDKTLKDYNIDNGKVIHLVKRAPPAAQRNNTNANANQQNDANRNRRFQSYRSEDGSFLMGTLSFDSPSGFINQMMRQVLTVAGNRTSPTSGEGNAESSSAANQAISLRNRINHIRRFLGYINTNFQILENPTQFPAPTTTNPVPSNEEQVLVSEYIELYNAAFAISDHLRPHMTTYFQSLATQPAESERRNLQNNHSILLRISHHLSHIMHLLTEFNVDLNNPSMPLVLNTLDHPATAATSGTGIPGISARIEISTSTSPIDSGSTTSMPRTFTNTTSGSGLLNQSPIVLMEVDTNINLPRNFVQGLRNMGNFQFSDEMLGAQNSSNQASENNTSSDTNATDSTNATAATANTEANNEAPRVEANIQNNAPSNSADGSPSDTATTSQTLNLPLSLTFDSYLNCNSTYTIPEVRSAAHMGANLMHQVVNSLSGLGSESGNNASNPLFDSLNDLFRTMEHSTSDSQSADQFEFFDLLRFLLNQFNISNEDVSVEMSGSPRIGDYLRSLNLFNSGNTDSQSIISELISVLFQNIGFEDLLHIINSDFHDFSRFRQPFQDYIRNQLLHSGELTIENIRREIESFVSANNNSLITIIANISPNPGVDSIHSFQNFVTETLASFFYKIMQSGSDDSFENDLLAALKFLVSSYIHFCKACFSNPNEAMTQLITNYFEQYGNYLNPRIRSYMSNIIIERINSYSSSLENDESIISEVGQLIVHTDSSSSTRPVQMETTEPDVQSISNDSEVEFSDAVSDFPSTSSTQRIPVPESNEQNWQSIVPTEWVPIITEDINKQKNIDSAHQPPFSDAYLNGMPKKRRLEHKPDDEDNPEPKIRPKPQ